MAKKALVTIDNTYRKVKKGYVTVDNVYRRIKKAYLTIGGVYRPCWSGGELVYYGTTDPLTTPRGSLAATSVGDYALFGGGTIDYTSGYSTVDVYDKTLTRRLANDAPYEFFYASAATVGDHALFFGGDTSAEDYVASYDNQLTMSALTVSMAGSITHLAAASNDNFALFGGGMTNDCTLKDVYAFDKGLVQTKTELSSFTSYHTGTRLGSLALFFYYRSGFVIEVFDNYLTKTRDVDSTIPTGRLFMKAATVGNHAIIAGGVGSVYFSTPSSAVCIVDTSLTRSVGTELTTPRGSLAATSVGDYALFGGGTDASTVYSVVDVYDVSLTKTITSPLSCIAYENAATSVGEYALFAGGNSYDGDYKFSNTVDVYTIA